VADRIFKYPRTPHLEGSRFQPGDEDLDCVAFAELRGQFIVVEEKLDGANSGISFDRGGRLQLQSRGHFLDGGARERQFALFKTWAMTHQRTLWELLGDRYVLYGEWLYAKHTVFYDALPHYFHEFDILDTVSSGFLSTVARRSMLKGSPVVSVPVLWHLESLIRPSVYKSAAWRERLRQEIGTRGQYVERVEQQTDASDLAEGLYIKVESGDRVVERYKFVRASFLQAVTESGSHWMDRPILPNQLRDGCDIFNSLS
jgi:hypothetical protein